MVIYHEVDFGSQDTEKGVCTFGAPKGPRSILTLLVMLLIVAIEKYQAALGVPRKLHYVPRILPRTADFTRRARRMPPAPEPTRLPSAPPGGSPKTCKFGYNAAWMEDEAQ